MITSPTRKTILLAALAFTLALACAGPPVAADAAADASLSAPAEGKIRVAFLVSEGATVIDWAGPWEVFQDVMVPGRGAGHDDAHPFELYTVAASRRPIRASAGLQLVPDYSFDDAPQPQVIVVPAQGGVTPAHLGWLREAAAGADLTMSVCTGAFILARAGLLDGREATTHHEFWNRFERRHPEIRLLRDVRWVEGGRVATAGGLTSGIDLALRTVARYFGEETAARTAEYMEHPSDGWRQANGHLSEPGVAPAAVAAAPRPVLRGFDPVLLVRGREVEGDPALAVERGGYRYHFATAANLDVFRGDPEHYEIQLEGACAAMGAEGEPGEGDPDLFHVHQRRIYIFAGQSCRFEFVADPESFLSEIAAAKGEGGGAE